MGFSSSSAAAINHHFWLAVWLTATVLLLMLASTVAVCNSSACTDRPFWTCEALLDTCTSIFLTDDTVTGTIPPWLGSLTALNGTITLGLRQVYFSGTFMD